ncbi:hypothetical protein DL98DRAFT_611491 [Cadophora sp. DSE1049]|nr:hypothetical protein DL98DRAFT_611491 [Cadophora sp. DSE1049]
MVFDTVPNQIIIEIARSLKRDAELTALHPRNGPSATTSLSNLCLCSSRMRDLAQPVLFSSILETDRLTLSLFLRTILERDFTPSKQGGLARFVTKLELLAYNHDPKDFEDRMIPLDKASLRVVMGNVGDALGLSERENTSAVLLLLLPRLRIFRFNINYGQIRSHGGDLCDMFRISKVFKSVNPIRSLPLPVSNLDSLKVIDFQNPSVNVQMAARQLQPFLKPHSLNTFRAMNLCMYDFERVQPAHMSRLDVRWSVGGLGGHQFENFLDAFTSLEHLHYENCLSSGHISHIPPSSLFRGLEKLKRTLKELYLVELEDATMPNDQPTNQMPLFADFEKLESLELMAFHLSGINMLPIEPEMDVYVRTPNKNLLESVQEIDALTPLIPTIPRSLRRLIIQMHKPFTMDQIHPVLSRLKYKAPDFQSVKLIFNDHSDGFYAKHTYSERDDWQPTNPWTTHRRPNCPRIRRILRARST